MVLTINDRKKSQLAFEEAQSIIPGGVDSPVRALRSVGTTPLFIQKAEGPYITDIDENKLIDFCMSWGVFILGHNNQKVSQAACNAVLKGSSYGIPSLAETKLAKLVRTAFPSMEKVRFVNSGTEATMSAIRVARGYTGKNILIKFDGCYHGHADHLLVAAGSGVANINNASSAGVPSDFVKYTKTLPYNDSEAIKEYFKNNGDSVAAVIVEPVACNMGVVIPTREFLQTLRTITTQYGAILIFDEVITGFRLAIGGAQQYFGIQPDMTTVGKIVGGGFPAAAFGGKKEIMNCLAPDGDVYQAGTLSGNPVAMAAGIATIEQLQEGAFYEELNKKSERFFTKLENIILGKDIQLNRIGSMFTLFFNPNKVSNFTDAKASDQKRFTSYFQNMLNKGIYVSPSQFEGNFISITHSDEILDYVLQSIQESI